MLRSSCARLTGLLLLLPSAIGCSGEGEKDGSGRDSEDTAPVPVDEDGDGYSVDEDCADDDPEIHPHAQEQCANGVDEDCDGIDSVCLSGDVPLSTSDAILYEEDIGDRAGYALAYLGDVDGDGVGDFAVGASRRNADLGAAYVVRGGQALPSSLGDAWSVIEGQEPERYLGYALAGPGDLDGDGFDDFVLSAIVRTPDTGAYYGAIYMFSELGAGTASSADAVAEVQSVPDTLATGPVMQGPADLSGDGISDLVIDGIDDAGPYGFMVFVCEGPLVGSMSLDTCPTTVADDSEDGGQWHFGGAADLNGDGVDDLIIGNEWDCRVSGCSSYLTDNGAVYIFDGPLSGSTVSSDADQDLVGEEAGDWAGEGVAVIGDSDGDGYADLAVTAHGNKVGTSSGALYIVRTPIAGSASLADADAKIFGGDGGDVHSGIMGEVAGPGDMDGDGHLDVAVSARMSDDDDLTIGLVWLVDSTVTGTDSMANATARLVGDEDDGDSYAGSSLASAGDLNGDGLGDLLVGDPCDLGTNCLGRVYVRLGATP